MNVGMCNGLKRVSRDDGRVEKMMGAKQTKEPTRTLVPISLGMEEQHLPLQNNAH